MDLSIAVIIIASALVVEGADLVAFGFEEVFDLLPGEGGIFFEQEGDDDLGFSSPKFLSHLWFVT